MDTDKMRGKSIRNIWTPIKWEQKFKNKYLNSPLLKTHSALLEATTHYIFNWIHISRVDFLSPIRSPAQTWILDQYPIIARNMLLASGCWLLAGELLQNESAISPQRLNNIVLDSAKQLLNNVLHFLTIFYLPTSAKQ